MSRAPRALLGLALVLCLLWGAACGTGKRRQRVGERPAPLVVDAELFDAVVPLTRALILTGAAGERAPSEALNVVAERLWGSPVSIEVELAADGAPIALLAEVLGREPGDDAPGVLLFAHATPFPVDDVLWREGVAPFDATLLGEHLVGRGVLDMHGPLAVMTLALEVLAREASRPSHPVRLLVVRSDQDSASIEGALRRWPKLLASTWVLGAGGLIVEDHLRAGEDTALISYATKGGLLAELLAAGTPTVVEHKIWPSAPERIAAALSRATALPSPGRLPDVALPMVRGLLEAQRSPLVGFATDGLLRTLGRDVLLPAARGESLVMNTCAVRRVHADGGAKVPAKASALLECRFLPGQRPAEFRDELLLRIDDPRIELRVVGATPASSLSAPAHHALDRLLYRLREDAPARVVLPVLSAEPSGLAWFRARGACALGYFPLRVDHDELSSRHGADERVRIRELEASLQQLLGLLDAMSEVSAPSGAR